MSDFEKQMSELIEKHLRARVEGGEPPPPEATRALGELMIGEFRKRHEKVLLYSVVAHAGFGAVLGGCLGKLIGTHGHVEAVQISLIATLAGLGLVVIKLWYWTMNTKIDVLKELKLLRLQMLSPESVRAATGESASALEDLRNRYPLLPKLIRFGIFGATLLGFVVGCLLR
jgi:hypothetical protein